MTKRIAKPVHEIAEEDTLERVSDLEASLSLLQTMLAHFQAESHFIRDQNQKAVNDLGMRVADLTAHVANLTKIMQTTLKSDAIVERDQQLASQFTGQVQAAVDGLFWNKDRDLRICIRNGKFHSMAQENA